MDKEILMKMINIFEGISNKWQEFDKFAKSETEFLGEEWNNIVDLIGDYVGYSRMETNYSSRDWLVELLYDFGEGAVTKEYAIEQLLLNSNKG